MFVYSAKSLLYEPIFRVDEQNLLLVNLINEIKLGLALHLPSNPQVIGI